jgi:Calcineurin-like phosphoesterase
VRTLVISDLHLGSPTATDLLRRPELRAPLLEALSGIERLVILGDGLELREASHLEAAAIAAPAFAELGRALGPDGEIVVTGGNHDHGLVAGWIDGRLQTEPPGFLGLEHRIEAAEAGALASTLAEHAKPARVELAYPGVWLRDDVYALHGHWSDVHSTVPTFERLAAGAMARWIVTMPPDGATPDDYEAILSPLYAWMDALAQRSEHRVLSAGAGASARAWVTLAGGARRKPVRALALGAGYSAVIAAINALGIGPVHRDLSGAALRRGGLLGLHEVLRRLGITAPHVIWGHSHRSGPWPRDDQTEWVTAAGTRIVNAGSWVYQRHFAGAEPNRSPYWPGTAVLLEDGAPPRLMRLLGERGHAELAPPPA